MRVRQGLAQENLTFCFDVDQSPVSRIFNHGIPLWTYHLKGLIKWPATTIRPVEPPYPYMPNTVSIIDGTMVFMQRLAI